MVEDCRYETTLIRRSSNQQERGATTIQKQNQQCSSRDIAPWVMNQNKTPAFQVKNRSNNNNEELE